jgi:hypothetical protein
LWREQRNKLFEEDRREQRMDQRKAGGEIGQREKETESVLQRKVNKRKENDEQSAEWRKTK